MSSQYSSGYYDLIDEGSLRSARVIAPLVVNLLKPASVLDVGCGRGVWLRAFKECDVQDVVGMDGTHLDSDTISLGPGEFRPCDLTQPFSTEKRFDLTLSLEVAEHLPPSRAQGFVADLASTAPVILFSAAVPGQGGTGHLNERWPEYWIDLFHRHAFEAIDFLRPLIRNDRRVEPWYRQNVLLFASPEALRAIPELAEEKAKAGEPCLEWLHAAHFRRGFRAQLAMLVPAALDAFRRRLDR
jgi:hypothetical protein